MKQTAVEWLNDVIESFGNKHELQMSWDTFDELIKQAKEMEKEQINKACYDGYYQEEMMNTKEYYDKTYN